jgi:hypothetical protein
MKEKDGIVDCPEQQVILYVEKEDGTFGPVQTGSYLTKNFLDDYESKRKHLEESLRAELKAGRTSPIHYYMVLEDLTLSELSARVNLRQSKVKKHLEPKHYQSLKINVLEKYAEVFNISVPDLLRLMPLSLPGSEKF